ncbi:Activin receptor type-2B [Hypsibius exemplaris]|uniref:receptor protein serine/threonine kinase n=1 Tax=Hypsibius exemplaris TaxID=2072580 RepID=A0A1W0WN91_HYPEX|nr:Activin receptor type-2B [Hypsibius exemplaris]
MEAFISLWILLCSVFLLNWQLGWTDGLVCNGYDDQKCKTNPDACRRGLLEFCPPEDTDPACFTFWKETAEGDVVIQKQGCWQKDHACNRSYCANSRTDKIHFCCCTGHHCNQLVRLGDAKPRPHVDQLLDHEFRALNRTGVVWMDAQPVKEDPIVIPATSDLASSEKSVAPSVIQPPAEGTTRSSVEPLALTWSSLTTTLVAVIVLICLLLLLLVGYFAFRFFRRQLLGSDGKKVPYDAESPLMMAPLMAAEYADQDGCVLLKNLALLERKAMGRYGEVWKGRLGEVIVAVKITPATELASWKNEVHIYHNFLMPNPHLYILRFILAGQRAAESRMFLVTEYHPRGSLVDLLKGRTISNEEADTVMCSMMAGLAFLHDSDGKPAIAHRDFKSTNVLIKADGTACIADFGLATSFEADERIGDKHGQVGTRRYMAPELLEGAISLNVVSFLRVDVYACGLVLWEILSRTQLTREEIVGIFRLPLEEELGTSPTNEAVQTAVVHKRLRPSFKPSWRLVPRSAGLCQTIEECWDADPEARPSASCLLNRMRQLSTGQINECDSSCRPSAPSASDEVLVVG